MDYENNSDWNYGWVFYKSADKPTQYLPTFDNCAEWIKGFAAAMADYDLMHENPSIQAALLSQGINGDVLEACLHTADAVVASDEWCRWPLVPVRDKPRG